jgi:glycosyltransferase involved in cell wall biosynthesis
VVNGVDTGVFAPVPGSVPRQGRRRRLVVPRRLFPKNGVEFFVRALPAILAAADVDVIVIGDGPERERLEGLAASLGVAARVDFLGARLHAEMPALLSSADLAVFPSLVEATSVAALESMACGLPVAASAVGGLPEIIDDDVGGLFAPGDPEALAARVLDLLSSPDGLRERGTAARDRVVARWSNERLVDRHLNVYRQLAGRRHRHREES